MRDPQAEESRVRRYNSKDTKRWCKGRVGIDHTGVWQFWMDGFGSDGKRQWERFVCTTCERVLKIRVGRSDRRMARDANLRESPETAGGGHEA